MGEQPYCAVGRRAKLPGVLYAGGALLILTGVVHLVAAPLAMRRSWAKIARRGWLNTVVLAPQSDAGKERALAFWSAAGSFAFPLILLGGLVVWLASEGREAPEWVGWSLLGYGAFTAAIGPRGGFWAILVSAALLLAGAYG
jgi:hypothetical protein